MSTLKVGALQGISASSDAITLANDGTCTANITNNLSNRNKVINGSMIVSQRNGTSAVTTLNAYNIDRWQIAASRFRSELRYDNTQLRKRALSTGYRAGIWSPLPSAEHQKNWHADIRDRRAAAEG